MDVKIRTGSLLTSRAQACVLGVNEGERQLNGPLEEANQSLNKTISKLLASGEITGTLGTSTVVHTLGLLPVQRLILVGLGTRHKLNTERLRRAAASAWRALDAVKVSKGLTQLIGDNMDQLDIGRCAQAITEGTLLASHKFSLKSDHDQESSLEELTIVTNRTVKTATQAGVDLGCILAKATNSARDLVNKPPSEKTPTIVAEYARTIAQRRNIHCEVWDENKIRDAGMNTFLAMAKGSQEPPRFVVMHYKGGGEENLGFVGKGVTFDSGGLSLKSAEGMIDMKGDMSGAAAVIAAMDAIAQIGPPVNVTALTPLAENMPSGTAYKPGDILTALNGKTIEVLNTDAEGRLMLADALSYAEKLDLSPVIDVATLTGACMVALGPYCTGAFSNDTELVREIVKAGEEAGESIWHMPLVEHEEYGELVKGDFSDVKNSAGRTGGAITAAWFLSHFAGDRPWAHLDIAPTFWNEKDQHYQPKGASGVGVRTLVNFAIRRAATYS